LHTQCVMSGHFVDSSLALVLHLIRETRGNETMSHGILVLTHESICIQVLQADAA